MNTTWLQIRGVHVARVSGRLDISQAETFETDAKDRLQKTPGNIILNLSKITYMSSSGIGAVLGIYRYVGTIQKKICLCEVSPIVKKLLDVVEIGQIFTIYDSEEKAIEELAAA
jgi:anti-sigma B factor antagonist